MQKFFVHALLLALAVAVPAQETKREFDKDDATKRNAYMLHREFGAAGKQDRSARLRALEAAALKRGFKIYTGGLPTWSPKNMRERRIDRTAWELLGPSDLGGRTRAILFDPKNKDRMFLGSAAGGLWVTTDHGKSYAPIEHPLLNLGVNTLSAKPDGSLFVAGTGEGFWNFDAARGAGLLYSKDGKKFVQATTPVNDQLHYVMSTAFSADGKTFYAACRSDSGPSMTWALYRATKPDLSDLTAVPGMGYADKVTPTRVVCHPTDAKKAVCSTMSGQVWSTSDAGLTWTPAQHPGEWRYRVEVTYAKADPKIVYASVDAKGTPASQPGLVFRSTDGGLTFSPMATRLIDGDSQEIGGHLAGQGWYANVIWADDPVDPKRVVIGGLDIWVSNDSGKTFNKSSDWRDPRSAHADQHCLVSSPGYNGTNNFEVLVGNDGGVSRAKDIRGSDPSADWQSANSGYASSLFMFGAADGKRNLILGGLQDNGSWKSTGAAWERVKGGDGGYCAIEPSPGTAVYTQYYGGFILRFDPSSPDSVTYLPGICETTPNGWKEPPYLIEDIAAENTAFYTPFAIDPSKLGRVYVGCDRLWRTDNADADPQVQSATGGPKWAAIKPALPSIENGVPNHIWSVTVSGKRVLVGHYGGEVFSTADATVDSPVWKEATGLPGRTVTDGAFDPTDPLTAYVSLAGYDSKGVWKTTDGGTTWKSVSGDLPAVPVFALAVHPKKPKYLYAGTSIGLFASEDGGATWLPNNQGPTDCWVNDLFWHGDKLIAATHGRGMWQIDLHNP